jgi:hypothetical protein
MLAGLSISLYEARRAAGDGIPSAIGGVVFSAALAPVTATKLLIAKIRG